MPRSDIFHPEYKARPYWWEAYEPTAGELLDVPKEARVAIVGGYAGPSVALRDRARWSGCAKRRNTGTRHA